MHIVASTSHSLKKDKLTKVPQQNASDLLFITMAGSDISSLREALKETASHDTARIATKVAVVTPDSLPTSEAVQKWFNQHKGSVKLIVGRIIGGRAAWQHGIDTINHLADELPNKPKLLWLNPGTDNIDQELEGLSNLRGEASNYIASCLNFAGKDNFKLFLNAANALIKGRDLPQESPKPNPSIYCEDFKAKTESVEKDIKNETFAIVAYLSWWLAEDTKPLKMLATELASRGYKVKLIYINGFRNKESMSQLKDILDKTKPKIVANLLGFTGAEKIIREGEAIWVQLISRSFSGKKQNLTPGEIAMQIATPELEGRIAFEKFAVKERADIDPLCQYSIERFVVSKADLIYIANYLESLLKLSTTNNADKKIAIMLSNYPLRDGRLANGVGLDTPNSVVNSMHDLKRLQYDIDNIPSDGDELIKLLAQGPSNQNPKRGKTKAILPLENYLEFIDTIPAPSKKALLKRWGDISNDPFFRKNLKEFHLPVIFFNKIAVVIQPARGWGFNEKDAVHDPELVPPHSYIATYLWIRKYFKANALIHFGKHGTLEWLPGKANFLSDECWSRIVLAETPLIYPFIVNDPGEGTQAKRRAHAVIIDHLMPPPVLAGGQEKYFKLERMLDEYADATLIDPRRAHYLGHLIIDEAHHQKLDLDCKISEQDSEEEKLKKLDFFLCEIKELQIRDGLHTFGEAMNKETFDESLTILARPERDQSKTGQSILRTLAKDIGLSFDPLAVDGFLPAKKDDIELLKKLSNIINQVDQLKENAQEKVKEYWKAKFKKIRNQAQLVAELTDIAKILITKKIDKDTKNNFEEKLPNSLPVIKWCNSTLTDLLAQSPKEETKSLLDALDGKNVLAGPSGAPSRGRIDTLPTGRNFYGVDPRAIPTRAALELGKRSALAMLKRYALEHNGKTPRAMTITAWGTAAIRTGGEDIAQALALIGAEPEYNPASGHVVGIKILPQGAMSFPRVDITLRVSGFFRDAFMHLVEIFQQASSQIMLEDKSTDNALRSHFIYDKEQLIKQGASEEDANNLAQARVFSSRPGTYGAGLNLLIDSGNWQNRDDFGKIFLDWSGYAYGGKMEGHKAHTALAKRLTQTDAVIQNQDNREHDILDADDFYQFEGGLASAVNMLKGKDPVIFHNDTSNVEKPKIRLLDEEIAQVVRARVTNPKWIASIMRHGYKGGAEMAASMDYLFAFSATTHQVGHHHFDMVYQAWLEDPKVLEFFMQHNPQALEDIKNRFKEAIDRGLWVPRSNRAAFDLQERRKKIEDAKI